MLISTQYVTIFNDVYTHVLKTQIHVHHIDSKDCSVLDNKKSKDKKNALIPNDLLSHYVTDVGIPLKMRIVGKEISISRLGIT